MPGAALPAESGFRGCGRRAGPLAQEQSPAQDQGRSDAEQYERPGLHPVIEQQAAGDAGEQNAHRTRQGEDADDGTAQLVRRLFGNQYTAGNNAALRLIILP